MPPVEFEPTISAGERPQTHVLDRAATGTGNNNNNNSIIYVLADQPQGQLQRQYRNVMEVHKMQVTDEDTWKRSNKK